MASFNWNSRDTILGGIYGRPVVAVNLTLYLISAISLTKSHPSLVMILGAIVPMALFGLVYAALLLRGPFGKMPAA